MSISQLEGELLEARAKYHDTMHASLQEREVAREALLSAERALSLANVNANRQMTHFADLNVTRPTCANIKLTHPVFANVN